MRHAVDDLSLMAITFMFVSRYIYLWFFCFFFFFQAEDGIRDLIVTGVQTCALPISHLDGRQAGGTVDPGEIGECQLPLDPAHLRQVEGARVRAQEDGVGSGRGGVGKRREVARAIEADRECRGGRRRGRRGGGRRGGGRRSRGGGARRRGSGRRGRRGGQCRADVSYRHLERARDADALVRIEQLQGQLVRGAGAVDVVRFRVVERAQSLRRARQGRGRIHGNEPYLRIGSGGELQCRDEAAEVAARFGHQINRGRVRERKLDP